MATRILNAATDGVTDHWDVPLNSGAAAAADYATALVSFDGQAGTPRTVGFSASAMATVGDADVTDDVRGTAGERHTISVTLHRYRDTATTVPVLVYNTPRAAPDVGALNGPGPLATLHIAVFDQGTGLPSAPPAGGAVEVWAG